MVLFYHHSWILLVVVLEVLTGCSDKEPKSARNKEPKFVGNIEDIAADCVSLCDPLYLHPHRSHQRRYNWRRIGSHPRQTS